MSRTKKLDLTGVAFIIYSLIVAVRGIGGLVEVNASYSMTVMQALGFSLTSVIFPLIMLIFAVFTFFVAKNRKIVLLFLGIYVLYYIVCIVQSINSVAIFLDMVNDLNIHLTWLVIYEINSVIQYVLYFVSIVIAIVGVKNIIFMNKTNNLHIISCILMTIAVLMQAIEYVSSIFVAFYNIGFVTAIVSIVINVILVVAVYLLGMQLNAEVKSDSILQE